MSYETDTADRDRTVRFIVKTCIVVVIVTLAIVFLFKLVGPQLNLYKANTEKQSRIAESKAKAEAAKYEAEAEVARAEGVAAANEIIARSITPEYLRYLYITGLSETNDKVVIYVPTEGMIPITEAGRVVEGEVSP
jgi:p-aminobenzoyl-glutamate transporter AbgT